MTNEQLPPLPEYADAFRSRWAGDQGGFTADQMRDYAHAALAAKVPNLTGLVHRLRGGGWDLRTPQEMADMIADMIESAAKPAQAQQAAEPLAWRKHHPGALKPTTVPGCTFLAEDALAMGWEPLGRITWSPKP